MLRKISKIQNILKFLVLVTFTLTIHLSAYSKPPIWFSNLKQIRLFETTKEEVEKLFSYPKITYKFAGETGLSVEYELKEGQLTIEYSSEKCSEGSSYGYNVAKDIVTDVYMELDDPADISKFGFDLSKFHKEEVSDVKGLFTYSNEDSSEIITASSKELHNITFSPSKEQEKLACKNLKSN
jgi:hypothetical protein